MQPLTARSMRCRVAALCVACGAGCLLLSGRDALAQFAVIDVASLTQLISEAQTLAQQLAAARAQIAQAQLMYQSVTGNRGMQQLLNTSTVNYLPTDWAQLVGVMQGSSAGYGGLAADLSSAVASNALLSAAQLAALAPGEQASIAAERNVVALLQTLSQQELSNTSARFGDIQQLISAIPAATDQKGALELQTAIESELALLQNEQTKLEVLHQAAEAEERSHRQRVRELIIAGHGTFANRFEPAPP